MMKTLNLIAQAVALMPFVVGAIMFAIGNPGTGAFCISCGSASVMIASWNDDDDEDDEEEVIE